jgi:hypothetical protein
MVGENLGYTCEELNAIYDKNNGDYWHCGKKLAFTNYGKIGNKGAWEVDHSDSVSRGAQIISEILSLHALIATEAKVVAEDLAKRVLV